MVIGTANGILNGIQNGIQNGIVSPAARRRQGHWTAGGFPVFLPSTLGPPPARD